MVLEMNLGSLADHHSNPGAAEHYDLVVPHTPTADDQRNPCSSRRAEPMSVTAPTQEHSQIPLTPTPLHRTQLEPEQVARLHKEREVMRQLWQTMNTCQCIPCQFVERKHAQQPHPTYCQLLCCKPLC